jgi:hypothetical protein
MSSTRHAVVLGPSFTGLGKRPSLTPCHHVDLATGTIAGTHGSSFGADDLGEAKIANLGKLGLLLSELRWSNPRVSGRCLIAGQVKKNSVNHWHGGVP